MVILLKNSQNSDSYSEYSGSADHLLDEICKLYEISSNQFANPSNFKQLTNLHTLNVIQREVAVFNPSIDKKLRFAGSDQATTCCILILRDSGTGLTLVTHLDTEDDGEILQALDIFKKHLGQKPKGNTSTGDHSKIDAYLCGGFDDDRKLSEKIAETILYTLHADQDLKICIKLACVCKLNNHVTANGGYSMPKAYSIGIDLHTGVVFPANFSENPMYHDLRNLRPFTGYHELQEIYDYTNNRFFVKPFDYYYPHASEIAEASDEWIKKYMSTSPLAEKPDFVDNVRSSMKFCTKNPDSSKFFRENNVEMILNDEGLWIPVPP